MGILISAVTKTLMLVKHLGKTDQSSLPNNLGSVPRVLSPILSGLKCCNSENECQCIQALQYSWRSCTLQLTKLTVGNKTPC